MESPLPIEIVGRFMGKAPVDVEGIARELGLKVYRKITDGDFSGKIECKSGNDCSITLNALHPETRQRFTLAHEIAHYILHRNIIGDGITDNGVYRSGRPEPIEREANRYAAEILMPWRLVREKYHAGARSSAELANEFGVSTAVADIRLKELQSFL
jgi:Zn-dependent peptidase ImmA (M78 family)